MEGRYCQTDTLKESLQERCIDNKKILKNRIVKSILSMNTFGLLLMQDTKSN
jgi:hypothetical protein